MSDTTTTPKPEQPDQPPATEYRQTLTADEQRMVAGWEKAHRRRMTDHEIYRGLEEFKAVIGEL